MADSKQQLSFTTISLHWLVGLGIIILMIVGKYMAENKAFNLYPLHKSIGTIALIFILFRVFWRIKNGWPEPVSNYKVWEQQLSKVIHWILIIGSVLFPLSGIIMSSMGGTGLSIFGLELVSSNFIDGRPVALNATMAGFASTIHGILLPIMALAIILHIAGAWKHHLIDKDHTLTRMLGKKPR